MKKAIITVLLLGMLIVPLAGQMGLVSTASATTSGSYPSWLFDPPWVLRNRTDWDRERYSYGYYGPTGGWMWTRPGPWQWSSQQPSTPTVPAEPQYGRASFSGIQYSTEVLKQAWIGGRSLQLRLFGDNNERSTFKITLSASSTGNIRITLTDQRHNESVKPVFDSKALQFLMDRGIDELVTVTKGTVTSESTSTTYNLETLKSMVTD